MRHFLFFYFLLVCFGAQGQSELPAQEFTLTFDYGRAPLTEATVEELDSLLRFQPPGSGVHLLLLNKKEYKQEGKFQRELSNSRYKNAREWFKDHLNSRFTVSEVVIPVGTQRKKGKKQTAMAGSNASYKQFAKPKSGVYSIVLWKAEDGNYGYTNTASLEEEEFEWSKKVNCAWGKEFNAGQAMVYVPPNAFRTKGGGEACCDVEVRCKTYLSKMDMVRGQLSTKSGNRILETGGMIYISAWCNDQELELKPNVQLVIYFPNEDASQDKDMRVFTGVESKENINWVEDEQGSVAVIDFLDDRWEEDGFNILIGDVGFEDSEEMGMYVGVNGYVMKTGNLGYINCDRFYDLKEEEKTDLYMVLKSKDEVPPLAVRMVFEDINSVLSGYKSDRPSEIVFGDVPRAEGVLLLAYGVKGDAYFLAHQNVVTAQGDEHVLIVEKMDKLTFEAKLKTLLN